MSVGGSGVSDQLATTLGGVQRLSALRGDTVGDAGVVSSIWTPASLYSVIYGDSGGFYGDPGRTADLFTTAAGTTNVAASGDPIGRWARMAGDRDWSQSVDAARPQWARMPRAGIRNQFSSGTDTFTTRVFVTQAGQYTLSFRGTGTVTLSGTSTDGPLVGTGSNNRVSLTFTPTAGNLTLTVSGSVLDCQIEFGAVATAYQQVYAPWDITEPGQPSIYLPRHNGTQFMTLGSETFGSASLFADAGQEWTTISLFRTVSTDVECILGRQSSTNEVGTFSIFKGSLSGGLGRLNARCRGVATEVTAGGDVGDGRLHLAICRWNGTSGDLLLDGYSPVSLIVGTTAEETDQNIISGARANGSSLVYDGHLANFLIDRALTNSEIDRVRRFAQDYYGVSMS